MWNDQVITLYFSSNAKSCDMYCFSVG